MAYVTFSSNLCSLSQDCFEELLLKYSLPQCIGQRVGLTQCGSSRIQSGICCGNHPLSELLPSPFLFLLFKLINYFLQGSKASFPVHFNCLTLVFTVPTLGSMINRTDILQIFFSQYSKESSTFFNIQHHINHCQPTFANLWETNFSYMCQYFPGEPEEWGHSHF